MAVSAWSVNGAKGISAVSDTRISVQFNSIEAPHDIVDFCGPQHLNVVSQPLYCGFSR